MTARQIFEATSIELSKIQAPALKLYEFNYLFNKAINQFINKTYAFYDVNQQTADDLRVLKSTAYLAPRTWAPNTRTDAKNDTNLGNTHSSISSLHGATYEVFLPQDYLHLLNCVCIYKVNKQKDCWDKGTYIEIPATRLTADSWAQVITDIYNRPSPMKPYYYLHNENTVNSTIYHNPSGNDSLDTYPASPYNPVAWDGELELVTGTDPKYPYSVTSNGDSKTDAEESIGGNEGENASNLPRTFKLQEGNSEVYGSLVEKPIATRVSNTSQVRLEIRYGKDASVFELVEVQVDYVKSPQYIRLTQEQIDVTEDTSQMMEFPDYVNQEIINELVHLVMEHNNDPRLSNNIQITNSIARPTGQQAQAQA